MSWHPGGQWMSQPTELYTAHIHTMASFSCYCSHFPLQDVKNASSTKESLDDLFPTEDEEQSQSKTAQPAFPHLKYILGVYRAFSLLGNIFFKIVICWKRCPIMGLWGCEGSPKVARVQDEEVLVWLMFSLASVSSKLWLVSVILLSVPATSQQCSCCSAARRLWDSSSPPNAPQPGHPIRLPGKIWGCCSALQTGERVVVENHQKYLHPLRLLLTNTLGCRKYSIPEYNKSV